MMNKQLFSFLGALLFVTCAAAQNKDGFDDQSIIVYKIKAGDTLSTLVDKYMLRPPDIEAIHKANQLKNINLLPIGSELNIPRHLVKKMASKATITSLSCGTPIRLSTSSKPLSVGTLILEGAIIEVPADCHVSMLLEDGSVIRLPSSASLQITTLRKNPLEPSPEVRLDLARGRVELDVDKTRSKTTPFEIRTPISIMGVRGTEFRVGYSPEDKEGQVEVLGGIVQTRGSTDAKSNAITKGLGVPIDANGKALDIEKLLPPPKFESATATAGSQPSYVLKLTPITAAQYYVADSANTANLSGNRLTQNLLAPELFVPKLTKQATFYQLTSVSPSGLVGTEKQYAFCAPAQEKNARCSAVFDAPLADGTPIAFTLSRVDDGSQQALVSTQNLQAKNGRFAIQGLPAGQFKWTLAYTLPRSQDASNADSVIRQSGAFELIVLPAADKP